jgi:2-polyprenyl-6-methoxyphenol hydroxylase-like FAD-dependent oxidoreductase
VLERRAATDRSSAKTNHISSRSMETFRRLGLADALRDVGLPAEHPHDCAYRTSLTGRELARTRLGSTAAKRDGTDDGADAHWPTPEPPHRVNQAYVEPILSTAADLSPRIRIMHRVEVTDVRQTDDTAIALARNLESGRRSELRAQFVIGCDGPGSTVRRRIGASLEGPPLSGRVLSTLIRAPDLMARMPQPPAWSVGTFNPRRCGAMFAIDGRERFLVHSPLRPGERYEDLDRDWIVRQVIGDDDIAYEILSIEDYTSRGLVASSFRSRRVFLAGDAAHLWMPFAGYGMNAGIADAVNLAWLLGAHLKGWAPDAILDAYEAERRPVTTQVARYTMGFLPELFALSAQVPDEIEDDTSTPPQDSTSATSTMPRRSSPTTGPSRPLTRWATSPSRRFPGVGCLTPGSPTAARCSTHSAPDTPSSARTLPSMSTCWRRPHGTPASPSPSST